MQNATKSIKGSLMLIVESMGNKTVGVISTLILARVLVPDDFGLVAIAILLLGIVDVLGNTSSMNYLLRKEFVNDDDINTAFTLNMMVKLILCIIFFFSASFIAYYFNDQRLENVIHVFSLIILIKALSNPAEAYLRRNHEYAKIVKVSLVSKVISVLAAVSIALFFKSYWALVVGQLTSITVNTIGSYIIKPYSPKINFRNIKNQWEFSSWIIPQSVFGYLRTQLDTFLVSFNFSKDILGSYHVLKYLCYLPISNIIAPAIQPLTVELSKVKNCKTQLSKQYSITFFVTMCLAFPITSIMYYYSDLIVEVLLGKNWMEYSNLLALMSFLVVSTVLLHQSNRVLLVNGKTKGLFYYEIFSFLFIYIILYSLIGFEDLIRFTFSRVALEFICCFFYFTVVTILYIGFKSYLKIILSTSFIIFSSFSGLVLTDLSNINLSIPIFNLLANSLIYLVIFSTILIILFTLFGRKSHEYGYFKKILLSFIK